MSERSNSIAHSALFCLFAVFAQVILPLPASFALEAPAGNIAFESSFSRQYTDLTKQILLIGVELERFSLNYRLKSTEQPKFRRERFFLAQETGAACGLAFEITGDKEFGKGRKHPLKISKRALHGALATAMIGSIIAGSDSCLELGLNALMDIKHRQEGFDPGTANRFVINKLKDLDQLLARRDALVEANNGAPGYARAVVEGKILSELRKAFINEYATFHADARGYATFTNLFFLLNAATNAVGATAAGVAYKAVKTPKLNGPANILFLLTGGMVIASPLLSSAAGALARRHAYSSFYDKVGAEKTFDMSALAEARKHLGEHLRAEGSLVPALPAVDRLALYTESDALFKKQILNETTVMRHLEKVAVESTLLGPLVGGALMTQGILGTTGYYRYTFRPRKQISMYYRGAIVGTTGSGLAVVATAAWLLASWSYENRLRKEHRLPKQLIEDRLAHLDQIEKEVQSL